MVLAGFVLFKITASDWRLEFQKPQGAPGNMNLPPECRVVVDVSGMANETY